MYLTSRTGGKSLRIVKKQVNGLGNKGKKGELFFLKVSTSKCVIMSALFHPPIPGLRPVQFKCCSAIEIGENVETEARLHPILMFNITYTMSLSLLS